jgi:hypothetical protein
VKVNTSDYYQVQMRIAMSTEKELRMVTGKEDVQEQ